MEVEPKVFDQARLLTRVSKTVSGARKVAEKKKVRGSDSQLYTSICPVVYVIRVFGLAPYEFHNDVLVPSSVNSIFACVCLAIYSYIIWTVMTHFVGVDMEGPLLGHTETAKAISNYFMAVYDIVATIFSRGKFVQIWNTMQDYDYIVGNLGCARNEKQTCLWSWFILCTSVIIWISVNQLGMAAFEQPWLENISYMIIYVGTSVSIVKFSGLTILLGQRFDHLNVLAKRNSPTATKWLLASPVVDIKDVEYLHNILLTAGESLNSLYSWPLLLWLGNLNLHIVSNLYFVIQRMIMCSWKFSEWRILCALLSWIVAFLAQLILLNYACHFTSSEANNIGYIMVSWKRWFRSVRFLRGRYENLDQYVSIHLTNRRLNFSAAGCFHVNLPLLRSIAGMLTTYLVILLQFPE